VITDLAVTDNTENAFAIRTSDDLKCKSSRSFKTKTRNTDTASVVSLPKDQETESESILPRFSWKKKPNRIDDTPTCLQATITNFNHH
jgi:hypothetical protein